MAASQISRIGRDFSVHDFVGVDLPFDAVVAAFANLVEAEMLGELLLAAWWAEAGEVVRHHCPPAAIQEPEIELSIGEARTRRDAVIVPVLWRTKTGARIPPLEADLEVVQFGSGRTHVHVLGRSELSSDVQPCTDSASLEHRITVAVVRHLLSLLSEHIVERAKTSTP